MRDNEIVQVCEVPFYLETTASHTTGILNSKVILCASFFCFETHRSEFLRYNNVEAIKRKLLLHLFGKHIDDFEIGDSRECPTIEQFMIISPKIINF